MSYDPGFYSRAPWRRVRAMFLAIRPVCQVVGCKADATHVDHIVSRRDGGAALDLANLRGLCTSCHSRKTASRDGGFGNRRGGAVRPLRGCDADGNPLAGWARSSTKAAV